MMTTTFRSFPAQDGTLVFEQGFPAGLPVLEPLGDTPSEGTLNSFAQSIHASAPRILGLSMKSHTRARSVAGSPPPTPHHRSSTRSPRLA